MVFALAEPLVMSEELEALQEELDRLRAMQGDLDEARARLAEQAEALQRADDRLELARQEVDAANRAKDDFLANVSHEIRTPMNAVLGMTELLLETEVTDEQRQWLRTVKLAADNLRVIIDDLLDFSKMEAGTLKLRPSVFRLRSTLDRVTHALAPRAARKGVTLRTTVAVEVPDELVGDVARLDQILSNLLGNAVKFTEHGEVVLDIAVQATAPAEVVLVCAIRDTGIGISGDQQATIFQAFTQQDTSTTRSYGGTGLGLAIAARLVAMMGGELGVVSELGRGSTFTFTARFAHATRTTSMVAPARARVSSLRVGTAEAVALARLIDVDVLLVTCDGDAELLGRIIASLRSHLPKELAEAHARFDAGDAGGLREKAHRLQGMISTASTIAAMAASELEDEAANGRLETSAALLARLDTMATSLLASLKDLSIEDLRAARSADKRVP